MNDQNPELGFETFARGIQLINSVLADKALIKEELTINSYYLLLKDLPEDYYLEGVMFLAKNHKSPHFTPSVNDIRNAVYRELYCGRTKDEFLALMEVQKQTKVVYSDDKLNRSINYFLSNDISEMIEYNQPERKQLS